MMDAVLPDDIFNANLQLWMIPYIYVIDPQWAQGHIYLCRSMRQLPLTFTIFMHFYLNDLYFNGTELTLWISPIEGQTPYKLFQVHIKE